MFNGVYAGLAYINSPTLESSVEHRMRRLYPKPIEMSVTGTFSLLEIIRLNGALTDRQIHLMLHARKERTRKKWRRKAIKNLQRRATT